MYIIKLAVAIKQSIHFVLMYYKANFNSYNDI